MIFVKENKKNWKIPFREGSMLGFDDNWHSSDKVEYKENFIFSAVIKPSSYRRGRSASEFYFEDVDTGKEYIMRIGRVQKLLEAISKGEVKVGLGGGFCVTLTFYKAGQNYGVELLKENK